MPLAFPAGARVLELRASPNWPPLEELLRRLPPKDVRVIYVDVAACWSEEELTRFEQQHQDIVVVRVARSELPKGVALIFADRELNWTEA